MRYVNEFLVSGSGTDGAVPRRMGLQAGAEILEVQITLEIAGDQVSGDPDKNRREGDPPAQAGDRPDGEETDEEPELTA